MFLMFGDEADADQAQGKKFFVYGAVFIPTNTIAALHAEIEKTRSAAGFAETDSLKSASRSRPKHISADAHRELKAGVMKAALEIGNVKFCAQVTLHELARNQKHDDLVLFGANTILGKFNSFLEENRSFGYSLLDRIPVEHPYRYLRDKFQVGLTFPDGKSVRLKRILGVAHTVDGSSNMCSVADILLGAFRYCVNEPENEDAGRAMFPTLMKMMWSREQAGNTVVNERGLVFRPANVREDKHRAEYDALQARLQGYLTS